MSWIPWKNKPFEVAINSRLICGFSSKTIKFAIFSLHIVWGFHGKLMILLKILYNQHIKNGTCDLWLSLLLTNFAIEDLLLTREFRAHGIYTKQKINSIVQLTKPLSQIAKSLFWASLNGIEALHRLSGLIAWYRLFVDFRIKYMLLTVQNLMMANFQVRHQNWIEFHSLKQFNLFDTRWLNSNLARGCFLCLCNLCKVPKP